MPMLPRRGNEIGEPVEELKWRELDAAIGPRPRGLSAVAGRSIEAGVPSSENSSARRGLLSAIRTKSVVGKPAVLPDEHVGGGGGVEQARKPEPADHAAAHPLGERGQVSLGD